MCDIQNSHKNSIWSSAPPILSMIDVIMSDVERSVSIYQSVYDMIAIYISFGWIGSFMGILYFYSAYCTIAILNGPQLNLK